eukprot:NP_493956.1 Uncharacterized protein CELE_F54D12.4 [Caenorhabditis elegans]
MSTNSFVSSFFIAIPQPVFCQRANFLCYILNSDMMNELFELAQLC